MKTTKIIATCALLPLLGGGPAAGQAIDHWDALAVSACLTLQGKDKDCRNTLIDRETKGLDFLPPLTIEKGGTYSGRWLSTDGNVPAVTIKTSEPVYLKDSVIAGPGNLIYGRNINGTISNVSGFGTSDKPGKFLDATVQKSLEVTGNRMSNVWGMRVSGSSGAPVPPARLSFRRNIAYNLKDGRETNAHFIQLVNGFYPAADISENVAMHAPWKSHIEDVLSIYNSWGTPDQPIMIKNNKIMGAYPLDPSTDGYSGGGIIVDGGGKVTTETSSAYIRIEDNVVVGTTNYGIAIASGHNNVVTNNTVFSSGMASLNVPIKAQNVGIYIWNINKQPQDVFFNNAAFRNKVFWMKVKNPSDTMQGINHAWLPDCSNEPGSCSNDVMSTTHMLRDARALEKEIIDATFRAGK